MTDPFVAQKVPTPVKVEKGDIYFWCSSWKSAKQPFCGVSQKDSGMTAIKFTASESKKVFFCGCKKSAKSPLYDNTHSKL